MEQSVRDSISTVVRDIVKHTYGEPTCIVTVKVLAAVLKKGWGIELTPHIVSLNIVPPKALSIWDNPNLTPVQKKDLIKRLPDREGLKVMEPGEKGNDFHVVGLSGSENNSVFWDPSIDQVNQHFDSCKLKPISLQMSDCRLDENNIEFRAHGCLLIYAEQKKLEEIVHKCEVWSVNYSALSECALDELLKIGVLDVGKPSVGLEQ